MDSNAESLPSAGISVNLLPKTDGDTKTSGVTGESRPSKGDNANSSLPALDIIRREENVALEGFCAVAGVGGLLVNAKMTNQMVSSSSASVAAVRTCQPPPGYFYDTDDEKLIAFDAYWDSHKRLSEVKLSEDHAQDLYYRAAEVPIRDPLQFERKTVAPKAIVQGTYQNVYQKEKNHDGTIGRDTDKNTRGRSLAATQRIRIGETIAMDTSVLVSVNDAAIYQFHPTPCDGGSSAGVGGPSPSATQTLFSPFLWKCCQHMIRRAACDMKNGNELLIESGIVPLLCSLLLTMGDGEMMERHVKLSSKKGGDRNDAVYSRFGDEDDDSDKETEDSEDNVTPSSVNSNSLRAEMLIRDVISEYCRHDFLDILRQDQQDTTMTQQKESGDSSPADNGDNEKKTDDSGASTATRVFESQPPPAVKMAPTVDSFNLNANEKEMLILARMAILCLPATLLRKEDKKKGRKTNIVSSTTTASTSSKAPVTITNIQAHMSEEEAIRGYRAPLFVTEPNRSATFQRQGGGGGNNSTTTTTNANSPRRKRYAFFARLGLDNPYRMAKFISAVKSNAVGITSCPDLPPSRTALFPFLRFAQHECRPNAAISFLDSPASHCYGVTGKHNYQKTSSSLGGGSADENTKSKKASKKSSTTTSKNANNSNGDDGTPSTPTYLLESRNVVPTCPLVTEHTWRPSVAVLTAIREIAPGEEITIAYLPTAYLPQKKRTEELRARYNFDCKCKWCEKEPDLARGFRCSQCPPNQGVVCPVGDGTKIKEWSCLQCGYFPTEDEINRMIDHEKLLLTTKADKHVGLSKLLSDPYVHYTHALVFKKIDEWSEKAWKEQDANMCLECIEILKKCVSRVLDEGDPARAQLFEFAGQVQHALGNAHSARFEFFLAFQHRVKCGQRFSHWSRLTGFMSNAKSLVDLLDSK